MCINFIEIRILNQIFKNKIIFLHKIQIKVWLKKIIKNRFIFDFHILFKKIRFSFNINSNLKKEVTFYFNFYCL